ncbi:hypothetical protein HF086_004750 [Spodoptera exigua]|uniref:HTH CENPB-type domain-containing protein n=1 Tax=Spodoptera exigua TaxID=7107 RepID=A0A922MA35_SPOEX|nr:hypothetical protein HF086_004750 [Spodoptera exigua]
MSLKRYEQIRQFLHFVDNSQQNGDRYFKVRPILKAVRRNCLKIEEEHRYSIDEMMVPYKGTRAGNRRQYLAKKPKKWGFKMFVRAGVSGCVYDFVPYAGEDTFRYHSFTEHENTLGVGAQVVIALCQSIKHKPAIVYFDNFFSSLELINLLRGEYGIFSLGTIRANRLRGCQEKLPSDKDLLKKGRGSSKQVVCNKNKLSVVKWHDNKSVILAGSYVDSFPMETITRYSKETKSKIDIPCPQIVKHYNSHMGGVDLCDMLISLYRTNYKTKRWYMALFSQVLDICVNDAWIMYRKDSARKFRNINCTQEKAGNPTLFSKDEEMAFIKYIQILSNWGFPLDSTDLRVFAQKYLNKLGKTVYSLKDNMPGVDWARNFMIRHKAEISNRNASNITSVRAKISPAIIDEFFSHYDNTIEGVSPDCIINYYPASVLTSEAAVTAGLISKMDMLFDSVNSDSSDLRRGKIHATNLKETTPHLQLFKEMKLFFNSLKFLGL